jgi:hypothetical protein
MAVSGKAIAAVIAIAAIFGIVLALETRDRQSQIHNENENDTGERQVGRSEEMIQKLRTL